ncbi:MAG: hypothetical protein D3918_17005 [Candidatus Electrothrix sp. AX2]|nr:hypothetical protein [Candidatus Electrothrix gigas]
MVKGMKDDAVREAIRREPAHGTGCQRALAHATGAADRYHLVRKELLIQPGEFFLPVQKNLVLAWKEASGCRRGRPLMMLSANIPASVDILIARNGLGLGGGSVIVHLLIYCTIALGNVVVLVIHGIA